MFRHVTVVIQGAVVEATVVAIRSVRQHLPGARVIVSTWRDTPVDHLACDEIVFSSDPGAIGDLKPGVPNNLNRQIVSTRAGLEKVTTEFALKMRADALINGHQFVELQRAFPRPPGVPPTFDERVVVSNLITINPRVIERLPFHLSDWFQFGLTRDLRRIWSAPLLSQRDATWYQTRPHARGTTTRDRRFLARFACEQHLWRHAFDRPAGETLVDTDHEILAAFDRALAADVVVVDHLHHGFSLPKKDWAARSRYYGYACLTFADWCAVYRAHGGVSPQLMRASVGRRLALTALRNLGRLRLGPAWL